MTTKDKKILYKVVFNPPITSMFFKSHPTADPANYPATVEKGFLNIQTATTFMKRVNQETPAWYYVKEYNPDE